MQRRGVVGDDGQQRKRAGCEQRYTQAIAEQPLRAECVGCDVRGQAGAREAHAVEQPAGEKQVADEAESEGDELERAARA